MKHIVRELKYLVLWLAASVAVLPFVFWWLASLGYLILPGTDAMTAAATYLHFFQHLLEPLPLAALLLPYAMFIGARLLQEPPRGARATAAQPEGACSEPVRLLRDGDRQADRDSAEQPPTLHLAALSGNTDMLLGLLEQGADFNARDRAMGYTPLQIAAMQGHAAACEMLIRYGAAPDAVTNAYDTALHLAAEAGHAEAVATLLKYRASIGIRNGAGLTAQQLAQQAGHADVVRLMEQLVSDEWPYLRLVRS
ncbi:MAG: ankyrin repeat domain-containing protein [Pseudomonadota bacterium]